LAELVTQPAVLAERVDAARAVLEQRGGLPAGSVQPRVAASIVFLGLSARLLSPALGATVLGGVVPELTVAGLGWRPVLGGPRPMATIPVSGRPVGDLASVESSGSRDQLWDAAGWLADTIVSGVVGPVLGAFESAYRVSPKVLWGNVASGLAGAVTMLASARPGHADAAARLAERMLTIAPLRGTGELVRPEPSNVRRFFVRNSCCLFYRVPGAGTCGDCVLTPEQVRRQQWRAALTP
jgi:hypothetical protein